MTRNLPALLPPLPPACSHPFDPIVPTTPILFSAEQLAAFPALIQQATAGDPSQRAACAYAEFFAATVRSLATHICYRESINMFLERCALAGLTLNTIEPLHVATHIEQMKNGHDQTGKALFQPATVLRHLSSLRSFFAHLAEKGVITQNPTRNVQVPELKRTTSKTPVLTPEEAKQLLNSIPQDRLIGKRDKAFIATMLFAFAKVSAVRGLHLRDVIRQGTRYSLQLVEKEGQHRTVPCHPDLAEILHRWIEAAGLTDPNAVLFPAINKGGHTNGNAISKDDALYMVKHRAVAAGLAPQHVGNHTLRATGITTYMMHGGTIESAATLAGLSEVSIARLYDRRAAHEQIDDIGCMRLETPTHLQPVP